MLSCISLLNSGESFMLRSIIDRCFHRTSSATYSMISRFSKLISIFGASKYNGHGTNLAAFAVVQAGKEIDM